MDITYYGHSCFTLTIQNTTYLFDPFITPNEAASHIDVSTINPDYICVSHGHQDHIADAQTFADRSEAPVIAGYEVANWLQKKGVEKVSPVNHGGTVPTPNADITFVSAVHSSTLPDGSSGGNPGGFIIETPEKTVYYSGDTALHADMRLFGEQYDIDAAILCIGDTFTMGADDAALAAQHLHCEDVIGVHYDTFPPIKINHEEAASTFDDADVDLTLLDIGASRSI